MLDATLAPKAQAHLAAVDRRVAAAQRRQSERAVGTHVFLVADARERGVEQPDDRSEHRGAGRRAARRGEVARHAAAHGGQRAAELGQVRELVGLAAASPRRVIAILLAASAVSARRLQVAGGRGTDPHVRVRRRDRQACDALQLRGIADAAAVRPEIREAGAAADSAYARRVVAHVGQRVAAGHGSGATWTFHVRHRAARRPP